MNHLNRKTLKHSTVYSGLVLSSLVLAACVTDPTTPLGADAARNKLDALQSDPNLAPRARVEIREAEAAVLVAEEPLPESDLELGVHRVYMADQKISIAEAKANTRWAEDQRAQLSEQTESARLRARTLEAEKARADAISARDTANAAELSEAAATALATQQQEEYQRQIEALEAKVTERGVVLTLGDVLFATGSSDLQSGNNQNLDKLVSFLKRYPDQGVQVEGHTDNVGSAAFNLALSQRRADSVSSYLTQNDIEARRVTTRGIGMGQPVATNDTATGRQQNRRVEIIIDNPSQGLSAGRTN